MRIFTGTIATESNAFAPMPTGLESFREAGYHPAGTHPDEMTLFAGPLWAARQRAGERGWDVVEGLVAWAYPSGPTTRVAYETLRDELLADLRAALPVDVVALGLHGAMVADGYDDCEGDLLARVRAIVGPHVVVGAELDPHHHLTPEMVDHADLLISFKEYPHTDILERAYDLLDLCEAAHAGTIRPTIAVVDCEMIVPLMTASGPGRAFVDRITELEGADDILSISVTHGFPYADVPEMGTKVFVYADGDRERAATVARSIADELIAMRERLWGPRLGVDEALDRALAVEGGPVVIADAADNAGGGAASDSTYFAARVLERDIHGVAIGPIWDPIAVRIAFEAGEGAHLDLRVGGKVSPMSGAPLDVPARVVGLRRDLVATGLSGSPALMGDCALVESQGVELVLVSHRHQAFHPDLFTTLGCDVTNKRIVIVKSANHFRAGFEPIAREIISANAPGSCSLDVSNFTYERVRRPKWPIDS